MDKFFFNIMILPKLSYFQLYYDIFGYFWQLQIILC